MKNKWMNIGLAGAVLLLAVIALCKFTLGNHTPSPNEIAIQQMQQSLESVLESAQNDEPDSPTFLTDVDKRNGYEVLSFEETEAGAIATVRVYAPDLYTTAKQLDAAKAFHSEADAYAAIEDAIKDAAIVEKQVVLEFTATAGGYAPILTAEFLDAFYGGVFRLYDDLLRAG